ncbi:hypothetical protein DV515_00018525, partial [Chloebia gouldiae]
GALGPGPLPAAAARRLRGLAPDARASAERAPRAGGGGKKESVGHAPGTGNGDRERGPGTGQAQQTENRDGNAGTGTYREKGSGAVHNNLGAGMVLDKAGKAQNHRRRCGWEGSSRVAPVQPPPTAAARSAAPRPRAAGRRPGGGSTLPAGPACRDMRPRGTAAAPQHLPRRAPGIPPRPQPHARANGQSPLRPPRQPRLLIGWLGAVPAMLCGERGPPCPCPRGALGSSRSVPEAGKSLQRLILEWQIPTLAPAHSTECHVQLFPGHLQVPIPDRPFRGDIPTGSTLSLPWPSLRPFPLLLSLFPGMRSQIPPASHKVPPDPPFLQAEPLPSSLSPSWGSKPLPALFPSWGSKPFPAPSGSRDQPEEEAEVLEQGLGVSSCSSSAGCVHAWPGHEQLEFCVGSSGGVEGWKESFAPQQVIAPRCDSDVVTSLLPRGSEGRWFLLCPTFDSALPVAPETVKVGQEQTGCFMSPVAQLHPLAHPKGDKPFWPPLGTGRNAQAAWVTSPPEIHLAHWNAVGVLGFPKPLCFSKGSCTLDPPDGERPERGTRLALSSGRGALLCPCVQVWVSRVRASRAGWRGRREQGPGAGHSRATGTEGTQENRLCPARLTSGTDIAPAGAHLS